MADAIDPNTFHKDSQDADTEETKSHNGSFVADSQEVLPDSDVVFSARTTTINSISGAELNVPKVTTLDPTFGDIYTSNEWASFESKVREIERAFISFRPTLILLISKKLLQLRRHPHQWNQVLLRRRIPRKLVILKIH